jgi:shikimate dehydrogenase
VRGHTELLLVVADPVAQVKAPEAFNLVFAQAGIDTVVVPAHVQAGGLAPFIRAAMGTANVRGLLLSIPHKTAAVPLLDQVEPAAIWAVNAVRRAADGRLHGAQFDGLGFVRALAQHAVSPAGRRALLLGAGGAGLAIATALRDTLLAQLAVYDIDAARAGELAERVAPGCPFPVAPWPDNDPRGFDLVVHATPLGLHPGDALPLDPARLAPGAIVVDILMTHQPTPLEKACRARGIAVHPGHEMLVQQVPAYLEFFGYPALASELAQTDHPVMRAVRAAILDGRPLP